jgi:cytochrome c oxidase subunit IV
VNKYWVILKAFGIVAILLVIKLVIDRFVLDVIVPSPIITALVAGVIFTMAAIFTGVLADYKESERIPGELAATIRNLYKDIKVATVTHQDLTADMQDHIRQLLKIMNANFRRNEWIRREINPAIDKIDEDIEHLAADGIAPAFITKIRGEMSVLEKLSYRIDTIMETNFLPSAYIIATIANAAVIVTLLFTKMDPYYEALALFSSVTFVLVSVLLLIRDMDNPFTIGRKTSAQVDLAILFRLEKQLHEQS